MRLADALKFVIAPVAAISWPFFLVVGSILGCGMLALLAVTLFVPSSRPYNRLLKVIRAVRGGDV